MTFWRVVCYLCRNSQLLLLQSPRTKLATTLLCRLPNARSSSSGSLNPDLYKGGSAMKETYSFKELLEASPLMKMGRPNGKAVVGIVTNICNDDLYVDFGGKFEAVVKKSSKDTSSYRVGSKVRLILSKLEMTGKFLGEEHHVTLCEADAILVGPFEENRSK